MTRDRRRRAGRRRRRSAAVPLLRLALRLTVVALAVAVVWVGFIRRPLPGDGVKLPSYVEKEWIPVNPYSRPGTDLEKIDGVVIHYVGNPGTSAEANRNYFASLSSGLEETYASSHFVVGLEGEVIQCVPLTEVAYATKERNVDTISIEVCHPDAGGQFSPVTYDRVVELMAWLCHTFRLDPREDVIRHYDATGKICPKYYVDHPEAWEQFRADVAAAESRE